MNAKVLWPRLISYKSTRIQVQTRRLIEKGLLTLGQVRLCKPAIQHPHTPHTPLRHIVAALNPLERVSMWVNQSASVVLGVVLP